MIFYYNASGTLLSAIFEKVYQGSHKANTIYFASPSSRTNTVCVAFNLPDGTNTSRHVMTIEGSGLNGVYDEEGNSFNVWKYEVPSAITEKQGIVTVQFYLTAVDETVSTSSVQFTVERGVSGITPQIDSSYSELVSLVSEYAADLADAEDNIDEKLDKRKAQTAYSAVYGYNNNEQVEFKVSTNGETISGQIPLYTSAGSLTTGTPTTGNAAANKTYVDTNFAKTLEVSLNNSTYVLTVKIKNASGTVLSSGTVDFPLESVVVGGSYDSINKQLNLSLKNGNTVSVPVGSLISGLVEQRTNDGSFTGVYSFNGSSQSYKTVSPTPLAAAVAEYSAGGVLKVNAPQAGADAVNKTFADENYGMQVNVNTAATTVQLTPQSNNEYFYGELSAITLWFSAQNANAGDVFYITFSSGNTATSVSVDYRNAVVASVIDVSANSTVEISGMFDGTKWLIAWRNL